MWQRLLAAGLALPALSMAFPKANPFEKPLEKCVMTTIYKPDVYVTVQVTETKHVTCDACVAENTKYELATAETTPFLVATTTSASALYSQSASGPAVTLRPTVHWSQNLTDLNNIVPSDKGNVYYASSGSIAPDQVHRFSWLNTTFAYPTVVLDHSSWISYVWSNGKLSVTFLSAEAYSRAYKEWTEEIILVVNAQGCGKWESGDSCYLSVTALDFDSGSSSCDVSCEVQTLKDVMSSVQTSWGRYLPNGKPDMMGGCMSLFESALSKYLPSNSGTASTKLTGALWPSRTVTSSTINPSATGYPVGSYGYSIYHNPSPSAGSPSGILSTTNSSGGIYYQGSITTSAPTITPPPQTTTSQRLSAISSSLSSYFSSLAASYSSSSGDASSSGTPVGGYSSSSGVSSLPYYPSSSGVSSSSSISSLSGYFLSTGSSNGHPPSTGGSSSGSYVSSKYSPSSGISSAGYSSSSGISSNGIFSSTGYSSSGRISSNGVSSSPGYSSSSGISSNGVSSSAGYSSSSYSSISISSSASYSSSSYSSSSISSSAGYSSSSSSTSTTSTANATGYNSPSGCVRGTDPIFGLPTTCAGPDFDIDLDSINGFVSLDATDFAALIDLFPGLITGSVVSQAKRSLHRRCEWYDVICDVTSVYDDLSSDVSSIASTIAVIATSDYSAASSAIAAVATEVASSIVSAAESLGEDLSTEAADVIAELENGLNSLLSFQVSTSIPINVGPSNASLVDSPWGDQVLLWSYSKNSTGSKEEAKREETEGGSGGKSESEAEFSVNVFCVNCGVQGSIDLQGTLAFDLSGITDLDVAVTADVAIGVGVGIDVKAEYSASYDVTLFQQGIEELCTGTTVCIGPYVKVGASLTFSATAEGSAMIGATYGIQNAKADLFAYGGTSSAENWTPVFTKEIEADGEIEVSVGFGLPVSIGIGLSVLDGEFAADASLSATSSLTAAADLAGSFSSDGNTTTASVDSNGCAGIDVTLDYEFVLSYDLLGLLDGTLYDSDPINIAETCIALGSFVANGTDGANSTTPTGLGSNSGNSTSIFINMTLIDSSDGSSLQSCSNGDVYKVAPGYSASDCSDQWLSYSPVQVSGSQAANLSIVADSHRRLPVFFPETIAKTNISRLRLVDSSTIPKKAEYFAFNVIAGQRVAVDQYSKVYYPVQCDMVNGTATRNEVFLVSDLATGLAILNSEEVAYSISNGIVNSCVAMDLASGTSNTTAAEVAAEAAALEAALEQAGNSVTGTTSSLTDSLF